MWENQDYCWVVVCKNHWFHLRQNIFFGHRIILGEADVYTSPTALKGSFTARCDSCGKEHHYKPSEVRRYEQQLPESFTPHPLFRLGGERRRSLRTPSYVRLVVRGESVEKGAFQEETFATSVSVDGALILLSAKVAIGQTLFLKSPRIQNEMEGRVARFGPPYKGRAQVGVAFAQPAPGFWPVESRPGSWKSAVKKWFAA